MIALSVTVTGGSLGEHLANDNEELAYALESLFANLKPSDIVETADYLRAMSQETRIEIIDGLRALVVEMEREP